MNPGYLSFLILLITAILLATGWKHVLAPDISWRIIGGAAAAAMLLPLPLWWSPLPEFLPIMLHAVVCAGLLASTPAFRERGWTASTGYYLLFTVMLGIIWGGIRQAYSFDPVFHWINPLWDAPLLAGLLCGAFTSHARQQLAVLLWAAMLGELVHTLLHVHTAYIGSLAWWDSFWLAAATARLFSLLIKVVYRAAARVGSLLWQLKGGRSS